MISLTSIQTALGFTKQKLDRAEWDLKKLKENNKDKKRELKQHEKDYGLAVKSLSVAQEVAKQTQKELEVQISSIVTSAIQAIFQKPYDFKVDFQVRRNKTEADLYLMDEDGNRFNPLHDNGGGIADVVAFSLRLACWRLNNPRTSSIIIYDEPLKFVSSKYLPAVAEFIKEISDKLNIQIIMISHIKEFVEVANNVIEVK